MPEFHKGNSFLQWMGSNLWNKARVLKLPTINQLQHNGIPKMVKSPKSGHKVRDKTFTMFQTFQVNQQ